MTGKAHSARPIKEIPQREAREMRRALRRMTKLVARCIDAIDAEMKKPSTPERGQNIAKITNVLEYENDRVRHFVLGEKLRAPRGVA